MAREHIGTTFDSDVEEAQRLVEDKLVRDPRGYLVVKLPAWFVQKLLDVYQEHRKIQLRPEAELLELEPAEPELPPLGE